MADGFWRFGDNRQPPLAVPSHMAKRPRSDFEIPGGIPGLSSHLGREDTMTGNRAIGDADPVNTPYEQYLRNRFSSHASEAGRSTIGALGGHHLIGVPGVIGMGGPTPLVVADNRPMGIGGRVEIALPPDASSTLYVEGIPANCTRREVAHIFRPFVGYKEVRLATKESRHSGADPLVLCFVDFQSPAHAATAMDALQGYRFDELDRDSALLRIQFSRFPGAKSGGGHRGKR